MGASATKVTLSSTSVPNSSNKVTVITYNTFLRPHIVQNDAQVERALQIPEALYPLQGDIICLQECWSKFGVYNLLKLFTKQGYHFIVRPQKIKNLKLLPAGLMTCSKFPIVNSEFVPFTSCSGPDCLATKGFLYTEIAHPSLGPLHVFNIHLQFVTASKLMSTDQKKLQVQHEQLALWSQFVKQKQFSKQDIVFLAGDWNFDCLQNQPEFETLLNNLSVAMPPLTGAQQVSVDPEHNSLVGRGNEARKYGCVSVLYTGENCFCCPSRWVDFVVYSTKHRQPVNSQSVIQPVKVSPFKTWWTQSCTDLSDHYPVVTEFYY